MTRNAAPDGLRIRLDELLEEYRTALHDSLDGLSEPEARASLVPSRTTLLGLLKHVTFVEAFWFGQALTGRPLREFGVASSPARSFVLRKTDTIGSVQAAHRQVCAASRQATAGRDLDEQASGTSPPAVWQLHLQVLRELAQHTGHADILREQVLAARR